MALPSVPVTMSTRSITPQSSWCASAARTDEAHGMRVVDHHHGVVLVGEIADRSEVGDHTVHREHAIGGDQPVASVGSLVQPLLQLGHVVVVVAQPSRLAQADAVDDRGMVEGIADHAILLVEDGLEETAVGIEARRVEDRVVGAEEPAELRFQLLVNGLRAADESNRGHAIAIGIERPACGLDHGRMISQPEVVVGAQVEHAATIGEIEVCRLG